MPRKKPDFPQKRGRKRHFDKPVMEESMWERLEACLSNGLTLNQCAALCKCDPKSIETEIKRRTGTHFSDYRDQKTDSGVHLQLRRKAVEMALGGNAVMMIWVTKNLMGWTDKIESRNENLSHVQIEDHTEYKVSWQDEEAIDVTSSKPQIS